MLLDHFPMRCAFLAALCCTFTIAGRSVAEPARTPLPNIVFVLCDDLGYGDPGCYNKASKVPTPNMDPHGFSKPQDIKPVEGGPKGQLYNLDDDPEEQNNLWLKKPEVVKRLTDLLEKIKADGRSRGK